MPWYPRVAREYHPSTLVLGICRFQGFCNVIPIVDVGAVGILVIWDTDCYDFREATKLIASNGVNPSKPSHHVYPTLRMQLQPVFRCSLLSTLDPGREIHAKAYRCLA